MQAIVSGISPGGSVSRWFGFTPLVDALVVAALEAAVVVELDAPLGAELELDDEPQPAITIEIATALSAGNLRIGPPDLVGLIAGHRRRPLVMRGLIQVNVRSKRDLALPSAHGRPGHPDRGRRRSDRRRAGSRPRGGGATGSSPR